MLYNIKFLCCVVCFLFNFATRTNDVNFFMNLLPIF